MAKYVCIFGQLCFYPDWSCRRIHPDPLYSADDPAPGHHTQFPARRIEPFADQMSRVPPNDDPFWGVKRWEAHKVPAPDPPSGDQQPTQPHSENAPKLGLKIAEGGFGFAPLFSKYAESVSEDGRVKVLAQLCI